MQPGLLNRRITIQSNSCSQDSLGSPTESWTDTYSCWAAINVQNGKQVFGANQFESRTTLQIDVRFTSSFVFSPDQRVVYKEAATGVVHTYTIESIDNSKQANRIITLVVYELGAKE